MAEPTEFLLAFRLAGSIRRSNHAESTAGALKDQRMGCRLTIPETDGVTRMRIETSAGLVEVLNEPTYRFGSTDNARSYSFARNLADESRPSSIHGLILDGSPIAVFGRGGGASGVHERSLVYVEGLLYLAVGDCVVCIDPKPFSFKWMLQTDSATCFGVHFDERHRALISHGELEISRFSSDGNLMWSVSGEDIFTGRFSLHPEYVEAIDWNDRVYRFSYDNGNLCA